MLMAVVVVPMARPPGVVMGLVIRMIIAVAMITVPVVTPMVTPAVTAITAIGVVAAVAADMDRAPTDAHMDAACGLGLAGAEGGSDRHNRERGSGGS